MSFEKDLSRLNEIVKELESSDLTLDRSLELYKEGVELSVRCKKTLEEAKLTIKQMDGESSDE